MLPSKRGSDDVGKFILCGNKRTCSGGDEKSDWISDDSLRRINPDIWSDMCKSVVSITLSYGGKMLFACSGIAIECQSNFTKFMTSASLVTALDDVTNGRVNVKIEVRHGGIVARGFLEEYDFDHAMAVIKVTSFLDVHCVRLKHEVLPPIENVVAVGCDIDGTLMNTVGKLTGSCGSEDSEYCILSTCQLSEVILGGALYGCDGTFLGMNLFLDEERAIFLPKNIILDCLNHLWPSLQKRIFIAMVKPVWEKKRRRGVELFSRPECSMKVNTSGGLFGDEYPSGVWGEFRNEVSSNIRGNVVALASFNGDTKFFSCTGFFINYVDKCAVILTSASLVRDPDGRNKIVKGLRIEVLLPNKARCEGKLDHYSLHYNVALVSVKNYNVCCPVNLKHDWINFAIKVVAVGFCFDSGALMAANGVHTNCPDDLDCENLCYTTCKTTKVGIGGPLVDVNGKFLGMNYYDKKMGTPFLCCDDICGILNYFRTKETKYWTINGQECHIVRDDDGPRNIWILPDSSDINEDELDSSDEDELKVNVQP